MILSLRDFERERRFCGNGYRREKLDGVDNDEWLWIYVSDPRVYLEPQ